MHVGVHVSTCESTCEYVRVRGRTCESTCEYVRVRGSTCESTCEYVRVRGSTYESTCEYVRVRVSTCGYVWVRVGTCEHVSVEEIFFAGFALGFWLFMNDTAVSPVTVLHWSPSGQANGQAGPGLSVHYSLGQLLVRYETKDRKMFSATSGE